MAYFIFNNYQTDPNTIYKIAEDENYLNNLLLDKSIYKIVNVSQSDFIAVKNNEKQVDSLVGEVPTFKDIFVGFTSKTVLIDYINNFIMHIDAYLKNNKNHIFYSMWNSYLTQLKKFKSEIENKQELTVENITKYNISYKLNVDGKNWETIETPYTEEVTTVYEPFNTLRNISLEKYFQNNNLLSYSFLQIP